MKTPFGISILAAAAAVVFASTTQAGSDCDPACQEGEVCRRDYSRTDEYECVSTDPKIPAEETGSHVRYEDNAPANHATDAGKKPAATPHTKPAVSRRSK